MQPLFTQPAETLFAVLAGLSLVTFTLSVIGFPWLVARLPRDCFHHPQEKKSVNSRRNHRPLSIVLLKNILGLFFFVAGIIMLFLPGQGIISILIGLGLSNFPYKQHILYKMTRPKAVQGSLDWLRKKTGKKPFTWGNKDEETF